MARFSLAQLEAFYWLAELGSFKAVAARLNVSQPTVTTRIKELERDVGAALIDRQVGRSVPTRTGLALLCEVRGVVQHMHRIANSVRSRSPCRATIRFGLPETLALTHLSALSSALADVDAGLGLAIDVDHSESLHRKILNDELDFALLATKRSEPSVERLPMCEIALGWAQRISADMMSTADPKSLSSKSVVATPPPSNLHDYTMDWLGSEQPRSFTICNNLSAIMDLIASGLAVGIVPIALVDQLGYSQKIAPIDTNRTLAPDRVHLAYRSQTVDGGHADALAACCIQAFTHAPRNGIRRLRA